MNEPAADNFRERSQRAIDNRLPILSSSLASCLDQVSKLLHLMGDDHAKLHLMLGASRMLRRAHEIVTEDMKRDE